MCVTWTGKWRVTKKSIIAYKRVATTGFRDSFASPVAIDSRSRQPGSKRSGSILTYKIGKVTKSRSPGIFLYRKLPSNSRSDRQIIKVRIPAGSSIRLSEGCINSTAVLPLKVVAARDW